MKNIYVIMWYGIHHGYPDDWYNMCDANLEAVCATKECAKNYLDDLRKEIEQSEHAAEYDEIRYDIVEMDLIE